VLALKALGRHPRCVQRHVTNPYDIRERSEPMVLQDILTPDVKSCRPDTDLAAAAKMMWDGDCGCVPVVDDERHVVGMITDRDICIAAATRSAAPSNIRASEVMQTDVQACRSNDDVRSALQMMRDRRVRRLPVVDQQQRLVGIVSLNDLVAHAECRRGAEVPGEEFLETMKAICAHPATVAV
jgi:CBS domain-containing protein